MWKIIGLCTIVDFATAQFTKATFVNYKVFEIHPITDKQVVQLLELNHNDGVSKFDGC